MNFVVVALLAAVATAAPQYGDSPERYSYSDEVPILRDERVQEPDGRFTVDVETGNDITLSQSGSPAGPDGSVVKSGQYSYTAPDGTPVVVKYVADANGYQPESDLLPVAPEFPHPIPQFVLDQIAFAEEERRNQRSEPSTRYSSP
ncbi:cuticle protein AMP1A-like [Panulirus ornatus]|uniref:cuticle protein AMP1A-like n=1 Tax=Panulirus ornatus TaxID=150431 RepID=UPI003A87E4FA